MLFKIIFFIGQKIHLKMPSAKWRTFNLGLNGIIYGINFTNHVLASTLWVPPLGTREEGRDSQNDLYAALFGLLLSHDVRMNHGTFWGKVLLVSINRNCHCNNSRGFVILIPLLLIVSWNIEYTSIWYIWDINRKMILIITPQCFMVGLPCLTCLHWIWFKEWLIQMWTHHNNTQCKYNWVRINLVQYIMKFEKVDILSITFVCVFVTIGHDHVHVVTYNGHSVTNEKCYTSWKWSVHPLKPVTMHCTRDILPLQTVLQKQLMKMFRR